ncbi:alpha/beta hydrolase [Alkalicoccobacillus murimartini]|uniref:Phospholipase/carboxylesterase n=1 Tax=Alkalicoccobacillus murimartini TaxID=171685 RepID=A0ABT9YE50_9BACI|nr:alpha/beta hydrolase [Alkalicoccobacillus murimartini]MDQ0206006.1 phospholipase/carboxylesterase [Alkalicoccobacillus murimartini]
MNHEHLFIKGEEPSLPTLLLLHGTGGDENDLLPLAEMIAPKASILSVRGNVSENGMNRYFRRLAAGVFDKEDLAKRTEELHTFVQEAAKTYHFDARNVIAVGYSNGANIAANLLYTIKDSLTGAVLFHAMQPQDHVQIDRMEQTSVLVSSGRRDGMIPAAESEKLIQTLKDAGADVTEFWTDGGHELTRDEVLEAQKWFVQQTD